LVEAGDDRVGALAFSKSQSPAQGRRVPDETDLNDLLHAASAIEQGLPVDSHLSMLLKQGSSLGGARPKATVSIDGELWLAKFPSTGDRLEIAAIEYACLTLARRCGIEVPEIRLLQVGSQRVMLTRRFDRLVAPDGGFTRCHFMSGLTLLGLHESEHSKGNYPDLADSMRKLVEDFGKDGEELFRRMIFNMLVGNDDDHLRNHAVILDATGWRQSPAYDLVPHPQQSFTRQQEIGIGSGGRVASYRNALSEAGRFGLARERAEQIATAVLQTVRDWETVFREAGVSEVDIEAVRPAFLAESVVSGFLAPRESGANRSASINPSK
jgi:serine/threonine-protein kinase HipA